MASLQFVPLVSSTEFRSPEPCWSPPQARKLTLALEAWSMSWLDPKLLGSERLPEARSRSGLTAHFRPRAPGPH